MRRNYFSAFLVLCLTAFEFTLHLLLYQFLFFVRTKEDLASISCGFIKFVQKLVSSCICVDFFVISCRLFKTLYSTTMLTLDILYLIYTPTAINCGVDVAVGPICFLDKVIMDHNPNIY
jgi:hypothetical protein